jgi:hypothetical protein
MIVVVTYLILYQTQKFVHYFWESCSENDSDKQKPRMIGIVVVKILTIFEEILMSRPSCYSNPTICSFNQNRSRYFRAYYTYIKMRMSIQVQNQNQM